MKRSAIGAGLVAAAVLAVLAIVVVRDGAGETETTSRPRLLRVSGTLSPRILLYGDTLTARVDVTLDRRRVDPGSVAIKASFHGVGARREAPGRAERLRAAVASADDLRPALPQADVRARAGHAPLPVPARTRHLHRADRPREEDPANDGRRLAEADRALTDRAQRPRDGQPLADRPDDASGAFVSSAAGFAPRAACGRRRAARHRRCGARLSRLAQAGPRAGAGAGAGARRDRDATRAGSRAARNRRRAERCRRSASLARARGRGPRRARARRRARTRSARARLVADAAAGGGDTRPGRPRARDARGRARRARGPAGGEREQWEREQERDKELDEQPA